MSKIFLMTTKKNKDSILINKGLKRAIHDHKLIENGDRILVAVSGGKDSLTMLSLLCDIQKKQNIRFDLVAAHIKTDFHCGACIDADQLKKLFDGLNIRSIFKDIRVLDKKGKTSCFWCSWNRRKTLFLTAAELCCNKIALGHHQDDIAETILLNLFYNGEISAMKPRQELFKGEITLIRPLSYIQEDIIIRHAREAGIPEQQCLCPFGAESKRKKVKNILKSLQCEFKEIDFRANILKGLVKLKNGGPNGKKKKDASP